MLIDARSQLKVALKQMIRASLSRSVRQGHCAADSDRIGTNRTPGMTVGDIVDL